MFCVSEDDVRKEHLKKLIIWINLFHITLAVCLAFAWRRCYYIFKALFFILGMVLMLHTVSLSFSFYSIISKIHALISHYFYMAGIFEDGIVYLTLQ